MSVIQDVKGKVEGAGGGAKNFVGAHKKPLLIVGGIAGAVLLYLKFRGSSSSSASAGTTTGNASPTTGLATSTYTGAPIYQDYNNTWNTQYNIGTENINNGGGTPRVYPGPNPPVHRGPIEPVSPHPAPKPLPAQRDISYNVQKGANVWEIAKAFLGPKANATAINTETVAIWSLNKGTVSRTSKGVYTTKATSLELPVVTQYGVHALGNSVKPS